MSETAETISRIESDSAASRAEAETKPPITPMPRRIDELGEVGVVILGDHKPSPCSRFVLKEYFD